MTIFVLNDGTKVEIPSNSDLMKDAKIFDYPHNTVQLCKIKLESLAELCETLCGISLEDVFASADFSITDFPEKFSEFACTIYDIMFNHEYSLEEVDKEFEKIYTSSNS